MTKMKDVAKMAGVSSATVSRVLAGGHGVKEDKKTKVLMAIDKLNYKPNKLARNLRKSESKTIVVVIPDISNPFFSEIILGIEFVAQQRGYHVLLGNTQLNTNMEIDYIELVREKLADGVILLVAQNSKEKIIEASKGLPIVVACAYIDKSDIPTVNIDNFSSATKVVHHFVSLGHSRIGFISGPLNNNQLSQYRYEGYCQGLLENQIEIDKDLIKVGDFTLDSGYEQAFQFMSMPSPPTAIFAANDEMAIGAIKALKEKGYQVPQDVAVVGFDDIKLGTFIEPPLTTISQPKHEIGTKSMEILLKIINNETVVTLEEVLTSELIIRQSCGSYLRS